MNGITLLQGDVIDQLSTLPDSSVHCVVTSPPYWKLRDYGVDGQIGLEDSPESYVSTLTDVFRDVRRVLRDDGTCWINIGDSYNGGGMTGGNNSALQQSGGAEGFNQARQFGDPPKLAPGLKPKDLVGIPWRLAFALQADGWWLRQEIIWHKPSPMPESVNDRCTKAHESVFLLTKSANYFYDAFAVREPVTGNAHSRGRGITPKSSVNARGVKHNDSFASATTDFVDARNRRSVWSVETTEILEWLSLKHSSVYGEWLDQSADKTSVWLVSSESYSGAHFACFPTKLIEPCILAGTSEHGVCRTCGAPWERLLEKNRVATRPGNNTKVGRVSDKADSPYHDHAGMVVGNRDPQRHTTVMQTAGWKATCDCPQNEQDLARPVVLDIFSGSGTTGEVARRCGCEYIGIELNPEYIGLSKQRLSQGSLLV